MDHITTRRLQLRPFTPQDAPFYRRLVNDPGWLRFIGDRNIHDDDAAAEALTAGPIASVAEHGFGLLLVLDIATGDPVGTCGLLRRPSLPAPDLGFAVLGAHAGRGLMTEAGRAVLDRAWTEHQLDEVLAITDPDNLASQRVLQKLGFVLRDTVVLDPPGTQSTVFRCARPVAT